MAAHTISRAMQTRMMQSEKTGISKARFWGGRGLSMLAVPFLVMDGSMKLSKPPFVAQATVQFGYPESTIVGIGVALLFCTALSLYHAPRLFGAILLAGYLGGAVASNIRAGTSVFNVLFPVLFVVVVWASVVLRDRRLGAHPVHWRVRDRTRRAGTYRRLVEAGFRLGTRTRHGDLGHVQRADK